MSSSTIGRRYERLLFFAGPLALACLLVLFVAVASDQIVDRHRASCLRSAADRLEGFPDELEKTFRGQTAFIGGTSTADYWLAVRYALIAWEVAHKDCESFVSFLAARDVKLPAPKLLLEQLRTEAQKLESKPLALYGIELPDKATIGVFGTPIKMDLVTLARALQIALGPILLLWLGSLYNTRQRESLFNARMKDVGQLYPHLVNVYPVTIHGDPAWAEPRKRSWTKYVMRRFGVPSVYAFIRISLLSVFVVPPVVFYVLGIYLLGWGPYPVLFAASGMFVGLFAFANLIGELLPWHVAKRFQVLPSGRA